MGTRDFRRLPAGFPRSGHPANSVIDRLWSFWLQSLSSLSHWPTGRDGCEWKKHSLGESQLAPELCIHRQTIGVEMSLSDVQ